MNTFLGAFMIGAIMAEARQLHAIERLIEPVRDMFSAIFFVTIGLLFDPNVLVAYALPIAVITMTVVLGKVVTCSLGAFMAGNDGRTSLRVGMGLAQIGEFSFIIATLGLNLKVISDFLYPIAVAVSAITTLLTPYLIRLADPLSAKAAASMPSRLARMSEAYSNWLDGFRLDGDQATAAKIILRILSQILVNCALVAAVFLADAYFVSAIEQNVAHLIANEEIRNAIAWGGALVISLPFLIAAYRKLQALSLLLADLSKNPVSTGMRRFAFGLIPPASIVAILLLIGGLSIGILPTPKWLAIMLTVAAGLAALLWNFFIRLHSRLQIALFETMDEDKGEK